MILTSLGITAGLPLLFFLLFATALLLTDLRPRLGQRCQSATASHAFAWLAAPLVPLSIIGSVLGGFLFVIYSESGRA
jgi:hypothetical protein